MAQAKSHISSPSREIAVTLESHVAQLDALYSAQLATKTAPRYFKKNCEEKVSRRRKSYPGKDFLYDSWREIENPSSPVNNA